MKVPETEEHILAKVAVYAPGKHPDVQAMPVERCFDYIVEFTFVCMLQNEEVVPRKYFFDASTAVSFFAYLKKLEGERVTISLLGNQLTVLKVE